MSCPQGGLTIVPATRSSQLPRSASRFHICADPRHLHQLHFTKAAITYGTKDAGRVRPGRTRSINGALTNHNADTHTRHVYDMHNVRHVSLLDQNQGRARQHRCKDCCKHADAWAGISYITGTSTTTTSSCSLAPLLSGTARSQRR